MFRQPEHHVLIKTPTGYLGYGISALFVVVLLASGAAVIEFVFTVLRLVAFEFSLTGGDLFAGIFGAGFILILIICLTIQVHDDFSGKT